MWELIVLEGDDGTDLRRPRAHAPHRRLPHITHRPLVPPTPMPQQLLLTLNDVSGFSFSPGPQHPSLASNDAGESPEPKSTMSTTVVDHSCP